MFIELLRNRQALPRTGMRTIGGLRGDIAIPKLSAAGTAYWLADEATAITESTQTFAQVTGSPKELGASTDISRKTLAQSSPDAEMIVRDDLATILALAKDAAGLQGTGTNGQPTGIASGATSVTTTANAPTWAQIVAFETAVASANADVENMAWVFDAAVRGNLKGTVKESGYPIYLMNDDNTLAGYPVVVSNQMTGGLGLFGNFSDAMFLDWEGVEVIVDEISLARERLVRVTVCLMTDVIVRHDESFAISSADMDATA
jgi:HK97 family phage major capsid protein